MAWKWTRASDRSSPPYADDAELLRVEDLRVTFAGSSGETQALRGLDLSVQPGRILGIAGESGSGKTVAALSVMGLLPENATATGSIKFRGRELLGLPERALRARRGTEIAMVFQETVTALNPVLRVEEQLRMVARAHGARSRSEALERAKSALAAVHLRDEARVLRSYPYELSGGMCQRVVIAMALTCGSQVLLADEPTTALDVSVQSQIMELIKQLVSARNLGVVMISHDLGVLGDICDDILVMYKGEVVEQGPVGAILDKPSHPYTKALLDCLPRLHGDRVVLPELRESEGASGKGCLFESRCPWRIEKCGEHPALMPISTGASRSARCWRSAEVAAGVGPPGPVKDVSTAKSSLSTHRGPLTQG
jgi:oligopeptide/dipeptide ABC transporter ATP-binding protein